MDRQRLDQSYLRKSRRLPYDRTVVSIEYHRNSLAMRLLLLVLCSQMDRSPSGTTGPRLFVFTGPFRPLKTLEGHLCFPDFKVPGFRSSYFPIPRLSGSDWWYSMCKNESKNHTQ